MLHRKLMMTLCGALCLAGCQTGEQYQAQVNASLDQRLTAYNGATMAEFMSRTGMLPTDAYPVGDSKVFVFAGPTTFLTLPATNVTPAVTRSTACRLMIRAVHIGGQNGGGADNWKIVGTQRTGPCNNLPL